MSEHQPICEICGYEAYRVEGFNYYAHSLPVGRTYTQQKAEFPDCWNNAKVALTDDDRREAYPERVS